MSVSRRLAKVLLWFPLVVALAACSDDSTTLSTQPGSESRVQREACDIPAGTLRIQLHSIEEASAKVVGRWTRCSGSLFDGDQNAVGIEIEGSGRWHKLRESNGTLEPVYGVHNEGDWSVSDTSAMNGPGSYWLHLKVDGKGQFNNPVWITVDPEIIELSSIGENRSGYRKQMAP